jgi:hypothetical protein
MIDLRHAEPGFAGNSHGVERHVDQHQLKILKVAEESERSFLKMVAGTYGGGA